MKTPKETIQIFGREVGDGRKTLVIAECGINHQGRLDLAIAMVDAAKSCGADAVKFQKRSLDQLYRPDVLKAPSDHSHSLGVYVPILRQCELTEAEHEELKRYCDKVGIKYFCSPWDIPSVRFLESLGVEAYKVPSACLSDVYLMEEIAKTGKPLVVSSGMHQLDELDIVMHRWYLDWFRGRIALMHCTSSYPTANRDVHLGLIAELKSRYHLPTGYSGHERGVPITVAAVAVGANIIERHFTMDRTLPGPDHAASLEPHGLEELIRHIRAVEEALGTEKQMNRGEVMARETLGKALTWSRDHEENEQVAEDSFCATSPGYGMPAYQGKILLSEGPWRTARPVRANTVVDMTDIVSVEVCHATGL